MFRLFVAVTIALTASSADAKGKPTREDAIACFERFIARVNETGENPRDLAARLIDYEAAAYIGSTYYGVEPTQAQAKLQSAAAKQRSSAFYDLDPASVVFSRKGKAELKTTGRNRQEYVFPLEGTYQKTGDTGGGKNRGERERYSFIIWLRVKHPLCEAVDVMWQHAQLSWLVNQ